MGLSDRQKAQIAKYREENPGGEERARVQSEERAKENEARAERVKRRKALQEAVANRPGWQYDSRNGDAWITLRPVSGGSDAVRVGCIAYVRADPEESGYESIVKGNRVGLGAYPFTESVQDPTDALKAVEKWLQAGLEGTQASDASSEIYESLMSFLKAKYGKEDGVKLYLEFIEHRSS